MAQDLARMVPIPDGAPNPPFNLEPPISIERNEVASSRRRPGGGRQVAARRPRAQRQRPLRRRAPDLRDGLRHVEVAHRHRSRDRPLRIGPATTGGTSRPPSLRACASRSVAAPRSASPPVPSRSPRPARRPRAPDPAPPPQLPSVLVDNVVSFQLDYPRRTLDDLITIGAGRSADVSRSRTTRPRAARPSSSTARCRSTAACSAAGAGSRRPDEQRAPADPDRLARPPPP